MWPTMLRVCIICRQNDLRLVLKAYAMYNDKTGYCQVHIAHNLCCLKLFYVVLKAMAPVAATLLMYMPVEVRVRRRGSM